jgi:hypothetical protein
VLELVFPGAFDIVDALSFFVLIASLVLAWRLTRTSLKLGAAIASAVFLGTFMVSLVVVLSMQAMFGLSLQ